MCILCTCVCGSQCVSLHRVSVDQLQSELRMEIATWQLLYVLSRDRVEEGRVSDVMETLEREGTSDKEVADLLFTQDSTVRQAQVGPCSGHPLECVPLYAASGRLAGGAG